MEWVLAFCMTLLTLAVLSLNILSLITPIVLFWPSYTQLPPPTQPYQDLFLDERGQRASSGIHVRTLMNFPGAKTVIFCHGSGGNVSQRSYLVEICDRQKINLVLFDYSGFGLSSGTPDPETLLRNGEAVYQFVTRELAKPEDVISWGESMGGGVASHLAHKFPCHSLVLMATFSSLDDILAIRSGWLYKFLGGIIRRILPHTLPTFTLLPEIKCPVAIIHSKEDDLIPFKCAELNFAKVSHPNAVLIPIKGGHASPDFSYEALEHLFAFCNLDYSRENIQKYDPLLEFMKKGFGIRL